MFQRNTENKVPKHFEEVYFLWIFQYLHVKSEFLTALRVILYVSHYGQEFIFPMTQFQVQVYLHDHERIF